eukprot:1139615-Pelagomonas_calceolata.AAC.3
MEGSTLKVEQATWDDTFSPTCDLCDAQDGVQDEQHRDVLFKCTHPHWGGSLRHGTWHSPCTFLSLLPFL